MSGQVRVLSALVVTFFCLAAIHFQASCTDMRLPLLKADSGTLLRIAISLMHKDDNNRLVFCLFASILLVANNYSTKYSGCCEERYEGVQSSQSRNVVNNHLSDQTLCCSQFNQYRYYSSQHIVGSEGNDCCPPPPFDSYW
jgi:hypothetical protein